MKRFCLFTVLLIIGFVVLPETVYGQGLENKLKQKYGKVHYMSSGGGWYCIGNEKYEGACDLNGKVIIAPNRYTKVEKQKGYYSVKRGEYEGACDLNGREVIPTKFYQVVRTNTGYHARLNKTSGWVDLKTPGSGNSPANKKSVIDRLKERYRNVFYIDTGGGWYCVENGECQGACNLEGKEIIPTRYYSIIKTSSGFHVKANKNSEWVDYRILKSSHPTPAPVRNTPAPQPAKAVKKATVSPAAPNSRKANSPKAVRKSPPVQAPKSGDAPATGAPSKPQSGTPVAETAQAGKTETYTISGFGRIQSSRKYTENRGDRQVSVGFHDDHITVNGKTYPLTQESGNTKEYSNNGLTFLVDNNHDMSMQVTTPVGSDTEKADYAMAKGKVTISGPANKGTGNQSIGDHHKIQKKECPYCHGTGSIVRNTYTNMQGARNEKIKCKVCGKYFLKSVGHSHTPCKHCNGKGYLLY